LLSSSQDSYIKEADQVSNNVDEFNAFRREMNDKILGEDNLVIKRFFNLDTNVYKDGALNADVKEMMGLVASLVLRCDDCVRYHLQTCHESGVKRDQIFEIFSVALVVGGSIVIPHLRRAVAFLDELAGS
jgi:AhpD family alkylhydroperoxidase